MTNRIVESIPNRQEKILQDTQDKKPPGGHYTIKHMKHRMKKTISMNKENRIT
jgi:hypothetical protein